MSRNLGNQPTLEQAQKSYSADQGVSMLYVTFCMLIEKMQIICCCWMYTECCTVASLSLYPGVRVTVGVTNDTCDLNQEALSSRASKRDATPARRAQEQPRVTGAHGQDTGPPPK